jgi:glycine cleavage system H protein
MFLTRQLPKNLVNLLRKRNLSVSKQYTETHEWLKSSQKYTKVGITQKVIEDFGEIIYAEPICNIDDTIKKGEGLVLIESVKAVEEIKSPFDCKIISINDELYGNLAIVNKNPECEDLGWFIEIQKL